MENQPVSVKSITSMGINLLRDVLKTTVDPIIKDKIEKRIKYLQDKYKNKKPKRPTGAASSHSTSSMDSEDRKLANEIKVIPFEEPLPLPRPYCELKDVPIPIRKHLIDTPKETNDIRELLDSIHMYNLEIIEVNFKLQRKL